MPSVEINDFIYTAKKSFGNIPKKSIGEQLLQNLRKHNGDEVVFIDITLNTELTYGQVLSNSIRFAEVLRNLKIESGDVISMVCENDISFGFLMLASFLNGIIFNPVNPSYYPEELKHILSLSRPKLVIASYDSLTNLFQVLPELDFIEHVYSIGEISQPLNYEVQSVEDLIKSTTVNVDNFTPVNNFDPAQQGAIILSSSGTTGLPKGVLLTHVNLGQIIAYAGHKDYFNFSRGSVIQVVPNFHVMGLSLQLVAMATDLKVIILRKFIPNQFLHSIQKYQVNNLLAVPSLILFLEKSPLVEGYDVSSLTDVFVGAAPVALELKNAINAKFPHIKLREIYGTTELSGVVTIQPAQLSKSKSSGMLIPGFTAKICKVGTEENLPPLEMGELCFKGPQVMKEYIRNESSTKESIDKDGFFHTGDLGYCDEDGHFYVVDRIKELIKYKGFQVAPAELENLIHTHPDVKECGVIGISDERAGEVPVAFVVKQLNATVSEQDIMDYVAKRISVQKRLYGGVKFVNDLPKGSTGKVLRKQLKELAKANTNH